MPEAGDGVLYLIDLEPVGKRTKIPAGSSLLAAAQRAGVELVSLCGGIGACDSCKVRLVEGRLSETTLTESAELTETELDSGIRLACQAFPLSDIKLHIPPESLTTPQRLQVEGREVDIDLDPVIVAVDLQVEPPSLHDLRADTTRLRDALKAAGHPGVRIELPVMLALSGTLRAQDWTVRAALREGELVGIFAPGAPLLGLAVDIGTTKVAAYLVDLETGSTLAKAGVMNPQIAYGEDVISRISYVINHDDGADMLQATLVEALNGLIETLCKESGVEPGQVVEIVAVGNTAMHHLLVGLPVAQLGLAPYVPAAGEPFECRAADLGLAAAPGAYLYLPANIAGYVGADHVAMILATDLWKVDGVVVALDIGTNTEISLANGSQILSCSCASGPAFEGAHIENGMRAAPGAIERVQLDKGEIRLKTIANQAPVGLCGSGILDVVAELYGAGVLARNGSLDQSDSRVRPGKKNFEFLLVPAAESGHQRDIVVTRKDINEIQLAKAAIRAGLEILLDTAGVAADDIQAFIVAGAFGTYIDIPNAIQVSMFPDIPTDRYQQVGNAAGVGARQMLISRARRDQAMELIRAVEYIELTTDTHFSDQFMKALYL
jgi:uncharacterized 2Fe-2S/4Fe-4S cluster protein (DUF4445 family)